jgi:two-component system OmpR family sensor kinase
MKWWGWLLALLPAGIGILVGVLANNGVIQNPVLYLRGPLSVIAFRLGLSISLLFVLLGLTASRVQARHTEVMDEVRTSATEERQRFLRRLDHEMKNPLTAVQTGLNNIADVAEDDYLQGEIQAVKTQVLRVARLVADLRKLAAIESSAIEKVDVDMSDLIEDAVSAIQEGPEPPEREFNLLLPSAPWPLPEVRGDPDLLLLAVHNLLDNAIKFSKPGDRVEVRAFEDGKEIVIEVADTGQGIQESEADQVWEELFRGEQARGIPGSGLGLSLVRVIVDQHDGTVGLRSRPDEGTVFHMRLPISS